MRVKRFKEHRFADLTGSLRNEVKVRGNILKTGVRWNQDNDMGATHVTVTIRNPAEPLLGVTALESVGIEVDPLNQRLKRRPAVRLKSTGGGLR